MSIKTVKEGSIWVYLARHYSCLWKVSENLLFTMETEQSASKLVVRDAPRSPISEMYHDANLKFLSSDKDLKVIAPVPYPKRANLQYLPFCSHGSVRA